MALTHLQQILERIMYLEKEELLLVQQRVRKSLDSIEKQELETKRRKTQSKKEKA